MTLAVTFPRTHGGGTLQVASGDAVEVELDDAAVAWLAGRTGPWTRRALTVDGRAVGHRRQAGRVRAGLHVVGGRPVAAEVPVVDHLAAAAGRRRATQALASTPRLADRGADPAGWLSGGERLLLDWARAVLLGPRVVVLDRAGAGLDADALRWAGAQVARWRGSGVAVLVRVGRAEEAAWTRTAA